MIRIDTFTFNPFQENTYVVSDETRQCLIIDPGCYSSAEKEVLRNHILLHDLHPVRLINTHAHLDHMLGNAFVCNTWNLLPELHAEDLQLLRSAPLYGDLWGIRPDSSPDPEKFLEDGHEVTFGNSQLKVLYVPGHCPGHIALYDSVTGNLIGGDVLFQGSIGRTDLPGGNLDVLLRSIRERLFMLPDETVVHPGHGPVTTIGEEKESNPFLT